MNDPSAVKDVSTSATPDLDSPGLRAVREWFARNVWQPFPFQEAAWAAYRAGAQGLIHAPTGTGKTYAAWLGPLSQWIDDHPTHQQAHRDAPPLQVLWITPLRALAGDTTENLSKAVIGLNLPWTVELRTGDTSSSIKQRQRHTLPTALITTPESLTLMLSYPDARPLFAHLTTVVVDEWHELLGTKRGVQTELALARLRRWHPKLRVWGLSATLGNLDTALDVLAPPPTAFNVDDAPHDARLISADAHKPILIDTLIPANIERFPWIGHIGLKLLPQVVDAINQARTTLVFTNTRAQTEIWFQELLEAHPDFAGEIALHHGSLQSDLRREIETRLRDGRLRCVVCTSSLDLGVDFAPVDQVIQIGSPKGVARLLQRAGRSGHQPGATSRILCVPTHAFELIEFAAVREAINRRDLESRQPLIAPLDVLVQHLVTMALGGGFVAEELLAEVRNTYAYRTLSENPWQWALDFVTHGGSALRAYDHYRKVTPRNGIHRVTSPEIARYHRMSIGTITAEIMLTVKFQSGASLGSVEEGFIARLRPGDRFVFAGRLLELVRVRELTAIVKQAPPKSDKDKPGIVPQWNGTRLPISSQLAAAVRRQLQAARTGELAHAEMRAVAPILAIQTKWSRLPVPDEFLIEQTKTRDGYHLFAFPLAGRFIHEGLSTLLAYRLTQRTPTTISAFANDYGFELLSNTPFELMDDDWTQLLSTEHLLEDILVCVNTTELARRQFRDIARIAGLIFSGYPGSKKSSRQLQTSTGLLFDVFRDFDPDNLLLDQARREVLDQQLDIQRLRVTLEALAQMQRFVIKTPRLTPFAFPIWADRLRTQVTSEAWNERIQRMVLQLERAGTIGSKPMSNVIDFTLTFAVDPIPLRLYAEGAMFWPDGKTLFITDPHFGKAESFRHAGIAIPITILDHDLARLTRVLAHSQANTLVVLGDFFHTRHSQSDYALDALDNWRGHHPDLVITLVQGNHDLHAGPPPAHLDITTVTAPHAVGPFICHHLPQDEPITTGYSLAGHLHPCVVLRDRDGSTLRLSSFIFGRNQAILPAFGNFTGGSVYAPTSGDRVFAIAHHEILEIPTARPTPRRR